MTISCPLLSLYLQHLPTHPYSQLINLVSDSVVAIIEGPQVPTLHLSPDQHLHPYALSSLLLL